MGRTVGLDGGLLFHASGPAEQALLQAGLQLWVEGTGTTLIRDLRSHPRGTVLFLRGIRRVEVAKALVNAQVLLERSRLPEDLDQLLLSGSTVGLPVTLVTSADPVPLGTVQESIGSPGHEVLVVAHAGTPGTFMLPLNAPYVKLDVTGVRVTDPPAGLLPD